MSATNPNSRVLQVPEQRNLFGGLDLVITDTASRRGPKRSRRMNVDARWKVGFAAALAIVVEHGKKAQEAASVPREARCPRCGLVGRTDEHFGTRMLQGKRVPQSWCRGCRGRHVEAKNRDQASLLELVRTTH